MRHAALAAVSALSAAAAAGLSVEHPVAFANDGIRITDIDVSAHPDPGHAS